MSKKRNSTKQSLNNGEYKPTFETFFELKTKPLPEVRINAMCKELIMRVRTLDVYRLSEIYAEAWGMDRDTFNDLCAKWPQLLRAKKLALLFLASKREKGALTRKLDPGTVCSSMAIYCEEWKELAQWKAQLTKDKDKEDGGTKIVIIERFPGSEEKPNDHVPVLEKLAKE